MDRDYLQRLDPCRLPSPCFVVDEVRLEENARVLDTVRRRTGAKILLALKGFAMFSVFARIRGYLDGTCASGWFEAKLGRESFGGEVHVYSPAFSEPEMADVLSVADHVIFNSFAQLRRFLPMLETLGPGVELGIRINPEHSEGTVPMYDPCVPSSRLGVRRRDFDTDLLCRLSGLHFHTLCEQNADALERTLAAVEKNFRDMLHELKWLNMGGGHHITRTDYDLDRLCRCIDRVSERYGVQVYLEPGEAVALNAGLLVATVLDVVPADMPIAILDTSAACHMPDVLEMPYRPKIIGAADPGQKPWTCRLAGKSCLAGDIVGEYAFDAPLAAGDRVAFLDMAIYSMVKTNTFNGVPLPAIARYRSDTGELAVVKEFGYADFKGRLS
ncbi:MAG: carboxynorspermidine decarboxylase [Pseudomonadota bacterium]